MVTQAITRRLAKALAGVVLIVALTVCSGCEDPTPDPPNDPGWPELLI